jgi:predicted hydrolase (HD superfamily)
MDRESAWALVRPTQSQPDTDSRAVRKKMKDKACTRIVNRDDLVQGAQELGVELDELIGFAAAPLKPAAGELDLTPGN